MPTQQKEFDCKCTGYDLYLNRKCSGCEKNALMAEQRAEPLNEAKLLTEYVISLVQKEPTAPSGIGMHRIIADLFRQYADKRVVAERERCAEIIDREREEDGDPEQLRNLLAAIREGKPAPPQWTRNLPTVPGWWWVKLPGCLPRARKVWLVDSSLPLTCEEGAVGEFEAYWCGPLEVPQ